MQQQRQLIGHLSAFGAYTIFGFNIIICKNIANLHLISPMGLFTLRSFGASVLFFLGEFKSSIFCHRIFRKLHIF